MAAAAAKGISNGARRNRRQKSENQMTAAAA